MDHFDPRELAAMSDEQRAAKRDVDLADLKLHWSVEDGEIVNDGKGVFLTSDRTFGDIELLIDYKTVALADSGIYLRATPQVQIWDYTEAGGKWSHGADKGSGGLWNNSESTPGKNPLVLADRPFGEWNQLTIRGFIHGKMYGAPKYMPAKISSENGRKAPVASATRRNGLPQCPLAMTSTAREYNASLRESGPEQEIRPHGHPGTLPINAQREEEPEDPHRDSAQPQSRREAADSSVHRAQRPFGRDLRMYARSSCARHSLPACISLDPVGAPPAERVCSSRTYSTICHRSSYGIRR